MSDCKPELGAVLDADIVAAQKQLPFCIVVCGGKKVVLRHGEYEEVDNEQRSD